MSLTVGELQVLLSGDTRSFDRSIDGLDNRAGKTEQVWSGAFKRIAVTGGAVLAGLGVASFLNDTKRIGIEYTNQLNTLQAVSGATAQQMADVGKTAKVLGSDLTLPATSAADAAEAMTELAKGGLSVDSAMAAAKGTLQLAAAAQIDAGTAATYQAQTLNAFSLSADQAGRVADVLANTANAASGEIGDFALGMAQASAVSASMGISLEDTAATLGLLANNGIMGADAGTLLKSALLALQSPSKPAKKAMDQLSLSAYDASGNFVGLSSVFDQLHDAQKRMTPEAYAAATSTLFGSDAARLAGIAGKEGADGFDAMRVAMGKQGAAADVAAAKSKGLGGAIEGFKSQVETFQIDLFERASPNIEKLVRFAADKFPQVGDAVFKGMDAAVGYVKDFAGKARAAFDDVAHYVQPVTSQVDGLVRSLVATHGPLDAVWGGFKLTAGAALAVANALHPLVSLAGAVLGVFNSLPGPIQTVVLGLAALKVATSVDFFGKLAGKGGIAGGLGAAGQSVVGFGQTVKANMSLADESVGMVSRTAGGLGAAFQTYMPGATSTVRNFRGELSSAFEQAKGLQQFKVGELFGTGAIAKSTGDLAGLTAATKTAAQQGVGALRSAGGSLVSFLGGPWGVALAGGALAVGAISSQLADSKDKVNDWAQAMLDGGKAASSVHEEYLKQFGGEKPDFLGRTAEWLNLAASEDDVAKKAREMYDALSPLEQKQQDVVQATNNLVLAQSQYAAGSPQVTAAADALRTAQTNLATAQGQVSDAVQTQIDKLNQLANVQLASVNSALAAQMSQFAFADQLAATNQVIGENGIKSDAAQRSLVQLAQSAISNAQAQGKAAADQAKANGVTDTATVANQAMLASLQDTARQMGSNTPAAITTLISSLQASSGTAAVTAAAMRDLGIKVTEIPGAKYVQIDAPTADQQRRIEGLGGLVRTLPDGHVYVFANTDDAAAKVAAVQRMIDGLHDRTVKIQAQYSTTGTGSMVIPATGQRIAVAGAIGGVVHQYAAGGVELSPMQGGTAQIVGPNTWRVIGDRASDDEAYIPINDDKRSQSVLSVTAARMGFGLVKAFADGGVVDFNEAQANNPSYMAMWNGLLAAGWKGNPNDHAERLYAPTPSSAAAAPASASAATGTGSGTVVNRNYTWNGTVREEMTLKRFISLQREAEAIYG